MTAGRPAKPTNLKILHGDRKDRINTHEPKPATREVVCPDWLSDHGRETWDRLAPDLIAKGVLTFWDVDRFADFCWARALSKEAMDEVERRGLIVTGDKGVQVKNPAIQVVRDAFREMATIAARFGLTPSDRARLSVDGEESDEGDTYLS
jgi:P27 family predicted phage terminase small subunit